MMTSQTTQDSGVHTMSSRRESAFSDHTSSPYPQFTDNSNKIRKVNSDCTPFSVTNHQYQQKAHSMEHLQQQQHQMQLQLQQLQQQTSECLRLSQCEGGGGKVDNSNSVHSQFCQHDPGGGGGAPKKQPASSTNSSSTTTTTTVNRLLQLCSQRLLPKTHRTANSALHIAADGEVIVELMRKRGKSKALVVCEVLRISADGAKIQVYEPNGGRGVPPGDRPPPVPQQGGAYHTYGIDTLPERHWTKYMHAYQFVALVKEKTPKITCYSERLKCVLMENLTDFEVTFYEGGSVTKSSLKGVTFVDSCGTKSCVQHVNDCKNLTGTLEYMWCQSQDALKHCLQLEQMLSKINGPNFPVIIGRRPSNLTVNGKENNHQSTMPSSFAFMPSIENTSHRIHATTAHPPHDTKEKKVTIPGIGTAVQGANGEVRVKYIDGSSLWMDGKHLIRYQQASGGHTATYRDSESLPRVVRDKLEHMPRILKHLIPSPVATAQPHNFRL